MPGKSGRNSYERFKYSVTNDGAETVAGKSAGIRKKGKVRYDRIAILSAIIIVLSAAAIVLVNHIRKSVDKPPHERIFTQSDLEEFGFGNAAGKDNSKAVFLSPSNQWDKAYTGSDTTEAEQMRIVAEAAERYLEKSGVTVYVSAPDMTLEEKAGIAEYMGVGMYVSIHSSAQQKTGTTCYFSMGSEQSQELAQSVYDKVMTALGTAGNGIYSAQGAEFYEISDLKIPSCLVEVESHAAAENAARIIENTDVIGKAVADGVLEFYNKNFPEAKTSEKEKDSK